MPTKMLHIPTPDGEADAFAAFPDGGERYPGVLMYADGFGIRPVLREMARELAGHGYYVLVPNYFYRHGPAPVIDLPEYIGAEVRSAVFAQLMPLIEAHTVDRVLSDADAYLSFLTAQPEVDAGPVGVTGYCVGGLLAMRTAAAHPDQVAAVAGFHCPVGAVGPDSLRRLTAEVHLGHAEGDMTPEAFEELNRTLDAAGVDHTSEIYPGTVHGFTMSDTDAFNPTALAHHWDRLLPLLSRHLGIGKPWDRFETKSLALMPGQRVRAKVLSHHPWGVIVEIAGHENAGLCVSIDMIEQFSRTTSSHDELLALFPPVGSQIDAVIERIRRYDPPVSVRLSIRPADLESLTWPCDFCGEPTTLSPGGDALVLDSRSNDGPGSHTVISHRHWLAERINPENTGERARALHVGQMR